MSCLGTCPRRNAPGEGFSRRPVRAADRAARRRSPRAESKLERRSRNSYVFPRRAPRKGTPFEAFYCAPAKVDLNGPRCAGPLDGQICPQPRSFSRCGALVHPLDETRQLTGFLGALCEPRTAPRAVARREAPRPQIRTKTGLGHDSSSPMCTLEKAPLLTGFTAPLRKSI